MRIRRLLSRFDESTDFGRPVAIGIREVCKTYTDGCSLPQSNTIGLQEGMDKVAMRERIKSHPEIMTSSTDNVQDQCQRLTSLRRDVKDKVLVFINRFKVTYRAELTYVPEDEALDILLRRLDGDLLHYLRNQVRLDDLTFDEAVKHVQQSQA